MTKEEGVERREQDKDQDQEWEGWKPLDDGIREMFTRDFWVHQREGHKREYIYDFGKALKCDHPRLKLLFTGWQIYECLECRYTFFINSAMMAPLHFLPIQAALGIQYFVKQHGVRALQEVLRTPIGQPDGSPQKAVLPEGASFMEALVALEGIDTSGPDGGREQLKALYQKLWGIANLPNGERNGAGDQHPALSEGDDSGSPVPPVPAEES